MPRILIVDDDRDVRASLEDLFALEGFEVATAGDGYAALTAVAQRRPDVIISDVRMPPPDGIRLIEMLRTQGVHIPSILITAQREPRPHQADAVVYKPFSVDALLDTVALVLSPDQ